MKRRGINWKNHIMSKFSDGIQCNLVKAGMVPARAKYLVKKYKNNEEEKEGEKEIENDK
ncbi:hypothetical protein KJ751_02185 [Patescibacteria group bacterium]|nr:hypothetical protein [Patescibacteria group bacterium]